LINGNTYKKNIISICRKASISYQSLNNWYEITKSSDWRKLSDIKNTFNSVDYVGNDRYVFNIKGNDYRIVTMIFFDKRTIYIRFVGTHTEYDKIDCSTI
jgi:mRNA interferase HigB